VNVTRAEALRLLSRGGAPDARATVRRASTGAAPSALQHAVACSLAQRIRGGRGPGHSGGSGGRRADLGGQFFRSSWESNYARYLRFLEGQGKITGWAYEAETFVFTGVTGGTGRYTPDFRVGYPDGHHEWHEVKGWMDAKSRVRLARMKAFFPDERVVLIDQDWFREAQRLLAGAIPGWERRA